MNRHPVGKRKSLPTGIIFCKFSNSGSHIYYLIEKRVKNNILIQSYGIMSTFLFQLEIL